MSKIRAVVNTLAKEEEAVTLLQRFDDLFPHLAGVDQCKICIDGGDPEVDGAYDVIDFYGTVKLTPQGHNMPVLGKFRHKEAVELPQSK